MGELRDSYTAIFIEDSPEPGQRQPVNIPALVMQYVERTEDEPMKGFHLRMTDNDRGRLRVLADVLGTSKSGLARELLHHGLNEAFHSLPDEIKPDLADLDKALAAERSEAS
jgi:hypothetical protein